LTVTDRLPRFVPHPLAQRKTVGGNLESHGRIDEKGLIRAIGVSNFLVHHLEDFLPECKVVPAVNQVEFHPELIQPELLEYCKKKGNSARSLEPDYERESSNIPVLQALAAKYQKTPVQIVLRWDIQKGVVTIPKSVQPERIVSNADIFDFELSDEDMAKIDRLDTNHRIGFHPDHIPF
jgi:methylglyoxal/glyoxal reductase